MNSLIIFVLTLFNVIISLFILRIWCQYLRVNTNNVIARTILLFTRQAINLAGNKVKNGFNISACIIIAALVFIKLSVEYFIIFDVGDIIENNGSMLVILVYFALKPVLFIIKLFFIVLLTVVIVDAILSWFGYTPIKSMTSSMLMPVYQKMRRFIPPIGMIDITPMILIFGLYILEYLAEVLFSQMFGAPFAIFLCSALV
ncbi:MAG: YggT family protein [Succinivibrionaceae bacterium]|nr:YggT family protein [Succinivibrionaceae bacterium]